MGRRARDWAEPTCYHITHRCHERRFFLKFKTDRRRYMTRLRQMSLAHPVDVLDFVVTSNHVLCDAPHRESRTFPHLCMRER